MRKRIIASQSLLGPGQPLPWIDLRQIVTVEVTSEDPDFPIETVFSIQDSEALNKAPWRGWRASQKGEQTIRLIFDQPLRVQRLQFHFVEPERERMQEFTVAWSSAGGGESKEIVRQQWNFSPAGSTSELEDYEVNLDNVASLELVIKPDLTRNSAIATLAAWREHKDSCHSRAPGTHVLTSRTGIRQSPTI
jgi:hypothetical protein